MIFEQDKFGERVRLTRKQRNLTQEKLALMLNVSTDHLGKIELGRRGVSIDLLVDLSNSLRVSTDFLLCGTVDKSREIRQVIREMKVKMQEIETLLEKQD